MEHVEEFLKIFSLGLRGILAKLEVDFANLQEIRLRVDCPLLITWDGSEYFVCADGSLARDGRQGFVVSRKELQETVEYATRYSLYAFEEEIRQGFLTIQGGHRIGMAGRVILEGERIRGVKHISFLNVRLSHEKKGCADHVLPYLMRGRELCHTLIISPPGCGKTTLLRDLIRQISDGTDCCAGRTVGVVDERSELGGCYLGVPQNDLGMRTDVLDCCPKAEGMMLLVRSMSPAVIAVDEIGDERDIRAIEAVIHCGCRLLATVHGSSLDDIRRKPLLRALVAEEGVFERCVVLKGGGRAGQIQGIFDERGRELRGSGEQIYAENERAGAGGGRLHGDRLRF